MKVIPATIGFGGYRLRLLTASHEQALRAAIDASVRCFDTAYTYTNGESEVLIGNVLADANVDAMVTTKIGVAEGFGADHLRRLQVLGMTETMTGWLRDDLGYSLHPEYLDEALHTSSSRLQQSKVEVVLLHNPEMYLQYCRRYNHTSGTDTFYDHLAQACTWLEEQCASGRIGAYGISSNTVAVPSTEEDALSLSRVMSIAQMVGGKSHNLKHLQTPFNVIEHHAATEELYDGATVLDVARSHGITVTANRPLNAIVNGTIIRLATHYAVQGAVHAGAIEETIHFLEGVEHNILQDLLRTTQPSKTEAELLNETFRIAGALCQTWNTFESLLQFREMCAQHLHPRIAVAQRYSLAGLYVVQINELLEKLDAMYLADENDSLEELRAMLCTELQLPTNTPLQHAAITAARYTQGIGTVLVGMRTPAYVQDVVAASKLSTKPLDRNRWLTIQQHLEQLSA